MKSNSKNKTSGITFRALEKIKERMADFTPRHMALAEYILQHPESVAFLSITELARCTKVSQATIVRFANLLGYEGYAQMVSQTRQSIQFEMSAAGRFRLVREVRKESVSKSDASVFSRVIGQEIDNLVKLAKSVRTDDFYSCAEKMLGADRICITGCLASTSLAIHFGQMLTKILPQVDVINHHSITTSAILRRITERSLVILIAFPRYPRETLELGRLAQLQGATIVAMTDSHQSPIVKLADISFLIPIGIPSFIDAYAAPIAFINALVTYVGEHDFDQTDATLDYYDRYALGVDILLKQNSGGTSNEWSEKGISRRIPKKMIIKDETSKT